MMIRQLHRDENVLFAGYKLPHPLQYKIIVRVSFLFFISILVPLRRNIFFYFLNLFLALVIFLKKVDRIFWVECAQLSQEVGFRVYEWV